MYWDVICCPELFLWKSAKVVFAILHPKFFASQYWLQPAVNVESLAYGSVDSCGTSPVSRLSFERFVELLDHARWGASIRSHVQLGVMLLVGNSVLKMFRQILAVTIYSQACPVILPAPAAPNRRPVTRELRSVEPISVWANAIFHKPGKLVQWWAPICSMPNRGRKRLVHPILLLLVLEFWCKTIFCKTRRRKLERVYMLLENQVVQLSKQTLPFSVRAGGNSVLMTRNSLEKQNIGQKQLRDFCR